MFRARSTALGALLAGVLATGLAVATPAATSAPPAPTTAPAATPTDGVDPVVADPTADIKDRVAALDGVSSVTEVDLGANPTTPATASSGSPSPSPSTSSTPTGGPSSSA